MSEKSPKTPFKLLIPNALMKDIDYCINTGDYNNRSEFIVRAIRDYVDRIDYVQAIDREYAMFLEKKKKEQPNDEKEE